MRRQNATVFTLDAKLHETLNTYIQIATWADKALCYRCHIIITKTCQSGLLRICVCSSIYSLIQWDMSTGFIIEKPQSYCSLVKVLKGHGLILSTDITSAHQDYYKTHIKMKQTRGA